jgi:hypothetical protein
LSKPDPSRLRVWPQIGALPLLIGATGIAGLAGYLVTWLVYRSVGPAPYTLFALFWSALYLSIGGLSGIQQEFARATNPIDRQATHSREPSRPAKLRVFAALAALTSIGVVLLIALLTPTQALGKDSGWLLVALSLGVASYVCVAVISGALYGVSRWGVLTALIVCDAVLRLALILISLAFTTDTTVLAWMVVVPFPATLILLAPLLNRVLRGQFSVDVGYQKLTWNTSRTVAASISTAMIVSGFPLLLGVTTHDLSAALLGESIFVITLARAPIVITVMSLQSYLVVRFKSAENGIWRVFGLVVGIILAATLVLAGLGWFIGLWALDLVVGAPLHIEASLIGVLVLSSGLVAILSVTGAAVLSQSRHVVYALGWALAAVATIIALTLPADFFVRLEIALIFGPVAGIILHVVGMTTLRRSRQSER